MVGWLVARWFLGGEMVGGEIPWWRDDRIPFAAYSVNNKGCEEDARLQNSRFRKARSAVSVILACEAREPHTPVGRVRREKSIF